MVISAIQRKWQSSCVRIRCPSHASAGLIQCCSCLPSILEFPASIFQTQQQRGVRTRITHDPLAPSWGMHMRKKDVSHGKNGCWHFNKHVWQAFDQPGPWVRFLPLTLSFFQKEKPRGTNRYLQPLVTAWEGWGVSATWLLQRFLRITLMLTSTMHCSASLKPCFTDLHPL